ncbi:MAG: DUF4404 family protein [Planctomycetaceae bacterium]|jgi:diadenosine tetraphosphate (Ap4A) HIT family hydrolase|nr:DUF4404 family protein [Planctomycetaceae bacterium]
MTDALNEALLKLRASLADPSSLDEQTLGELAQLANDIEQALEEAKPESLQDTGLAERLRDWIEQLESEHPEWTRTLSMVAERLADMGI